jgi:pimeloyl-ACP methyl ester carboxylesterase
VLFIVTDMNAPVLVLVHGYPFDHTLWDKVMPCLDPKLKVLAPDLRGFYGQPTGNAEPSLDRMAEDIHRLLDQQRVERVVVAGMSMGGYIGLAFAERYPEHLAGFGLISSHAQADSDEARSGRRTAIENIRREGPSAASQASIAKVFAPANSRNPELVRYPQTSAEKAGSEGLIWALEAMARRPDRTQVLQALRVPVLIVHGVEDQFIPVERARQVATNLPQAQYMEIANAGHATPLEAPILVAEALTNLVRRSFATSGL